MEVLNRIKERLNKWSECTSIDELNKKWVNAKKYIIKNSSSIEERFMLDKLIEDSYSIALNKILEKKIKIFFIFSVLFEFY